jgi:hypothetical protein
LEKLRYTRKVGIGFEKEVIIVSSKILTHFKGKMSSTLETILTISREFEYLEGLFKLPKR